MPKKKKLSKSYKRGLRKSSGGLSKFAILLIIAGVVLATIVGGYLLFSNTGLFNQQLAGLPKITKPSPDMARARQMTLYPDVDNIMQVNSRDNITITLLVPKGAVDKETKIQMIPYYYEAKSEDPSAGVLIGPGSLSFNYPVTVLFDLEKSPLRTDGPENKKTVDANRVTGKSQVLMIDQNATELIPTLVARDVETATQLRARILTGGGYVISVNGKDQQRWAKNAMDKEDMNVLSTLESAAVLLSSDAGLNKKEKSKAHAAAQKILEKKIPTPHEMFAALSVLKLLDQKKTSFIPQSYAAENYIPAAATTPQQVIALMCKSTSTGLKPEEYLGYAAAAKSFGLMDLHDKCVTVAGNKAIQNAEKVLNDPNATFTQILVAKADIEFIGIDDLSDIDEKLFEKYNWKAKDEARRVAYDLDATSQQIAAAIQRLKDANIPDGPESDLLYERFKKELEEDGGEPPPPPPPSDPVEHSYNEQEIIYDQAMTMIGIGFLQMMGITDFSQEGLQKKFDEMKMGAEMFAEAAYTLCKELDGDNCDSTYAEAQRNIQKATEESYKLTSEIGKLENKAFETPDYDDEGASYYYELTPTPTEEEYMNLNDEEENGEEEIYYEDPADYYEDDHDYIESSLEEGTEEEYQNDPNATYEGYGADGQYIGEDGGESHEEEVQGASNTNFINIIFQKIANTLGF